MPIRVVLRLSKKHKGVPHGQIVIEGQQTSTAAVPLTEYHESIQSALADLPAGSSIECEDEADPMPSTVQPRGGAQAAPPAPKQAIVAPAQELAGQRAKREGGPGKRREPRDSASGHSARGAMPHSGHSPFDRKSVYNFAEWDYNSLPLRAQAPDRAGHDRWHEGRLSGVLSVEFASKTPVFVPASGGPDKPGGLQDFWSCGRDDSGAPRYALPGSSVKGAVRALFEAWTNSRAGILSTPDYTHSLSFRRRTTAAWVVEGPAAGGGLAVRSLEAHFVWYSRRDREWLHKRGGTPRPWPEAPDAWVRTAPPIQQQVDLHDRKWQAIELRANLYWVPSKRHRHHPRPNQKILAVRLDSDTAMIPADTVAAYRRNLDSPAFGNHGKQVEKAPVRDFYTGIKKERMAPAPGDPPGMHYNKDDLYRLAPGDIVFGCLHPAKGSKELICFGKNFNFIWPSSSTPRELVGDFWPRTFPALDEDTDWAEATFGFAGPYREDQRSHPFRGRVRFEPFWAQPGASPKAMTLKGLMTPSGAKLKARPLYLPPLPDGSSSSYPGQAAPAATSDRFRGPKFYWHQSAPGQALGGIAPAHKGGQEDNPPTEHLDLHAMPADTRFSGNVHFDNLREAELGALIASVSPGLFWGQANRYGLKLGKAKPRGLGSVVGTITSLRLRRPAAQAYAGLSTDPLAAPAEPRDIENAVDTFREVVKAGGAPAHRVADLQKLLRLPDSPTVRDYLEPQAYGWLPALDSPWGERRAKDGPLPAMRAARDIEVK